MDRRVPLSDLPSAENPDTISASVDCVARYCRRKNKELRVKVPLEYFNFIASLRQVALGVTVVEREHIASSNKSCNLICNQTPDPIWAVQTPRETACGEDLEFQHSSRAFPLGPVGMGNDKEAAVLQDFSAGPEIPEAMDAPIDEVLSGKSGASLESHTEIAKADSHGPRPDPSRKRSAASAFDEDSLVAKIRPVVNQQIEEALLPLMSALRSREEDEHKHRQKMLALEQEKLTLMRQKLECTRRSNAVPASDAK